MRGQLQLPCIHQTLHAPSKHLSTELKRLIAALLLTGICITIQQAEARQRVLVYEHCHYGGYQILLPSEETITQQGLNHFIAPPANARNSISSIAVEGVDTYSFRADSPGGPDSFYLTSSYDCLADAGWDNQINSMQVYGPKYSLDSFPIFDEGNGDDGRIRQGAYITNSTRAWPLDWMREFATGWMGYIPDAMPITQMSIPATHNSYARTSPLPHCNTQVMTISEQLGAGIRFFDMRGTMVNGEIHMLHGDESKCKTENTLEYWFSVYRDFLQKNPSETVIVLFNKNGGQNTSDIGNAFRSFAGNYRDVIFKANTRHGKMPRLGEIRGKIFIISDTPLGDEWAFHRSSFPGVVDEQNGNIPGEPGHIPIINKDGFKSPDHEGKARIVADQFNKSNQSWATTNPPETLYLNWLSAYFIALDLDLDFSRMTDEAYIRQKVAETTFDDVTKIPAILSNALTTAGTTPLTIANEVNERAFHTIGGMGGHNGWMRRKLGVVLMDYPGDRLTYRIIKSNFSPTRPPDNNFASVSPSQMPAVFQITSDRSGKCVNMGGNGANETWQTQWDCDRNNLQQHYRLMDSGNGNARIYNLASQRCMGLDGGSHDRGTRIINYDCYGPGSIHDFRIERRGTTFRFVNQESGRCLDLDYGSQDNGAPFHLWDCDAGNENQHFSINTVMDNFPMERNRFQLRITASEKCMNMGGNGANGTQHTQWDCDQSNQQQHYTLRAMSKDVFQLFNESSGRCLGVEGGSQEDGARVVNWDCAPRPGTDHDWQIIADGDRFRFQNANTGKCLDLYQGNQENGAGFAQWSCAPGHANQTFSLTPLN